MTLSVLNDKSYYKVIINLPISLVPLYMPKIEDIVLTKKRTFL